MAEETKYFVDKKGRFLGAFAGVTPPEAVIEVQPPNHCKDTWSFIEKRWIPFEPPVEQKRRTAYEAELGSLEDQLDALFKGLSVLLPAIQRADILTPEELSALTPDAEKPADTPAGWLGKIAGIKQRIKKEG
ncbi:MAG: hypothetical protein K2Y32_00335 [Candidatus Obscuribacterales bacterium]|nr:hypothetical protein [Candidatus Obscuribacterales bacterium]